MWIDDLLARAGLPPMRDNELLAQEGLDNRLRRVTLVDGQQLLARQPRGDDRHDPSPRARFLEEHRVGSPKLYASAGDGSSLVAWIPGTPLARHLAETENDATSVVWRQLGVALAAVHFVTFPRRLQGEFGPSELILHPVDPVDQLHASIRRSQGWVEQCRPHLIRGHQRLVGVVDQYADDIRAEQPCLVHGDVNFDNFIVTGDSVRVIDWDYPRVGYPLAELSALDEHAYLNGCSDGLPPQFWHGYGRSRPDALLLLYRAVGCLGWLAGSDWAEWEADQDLSEQTRSKLRNWNRRLITWADTLPQQLP